MEITLRPDQNQLIRDYRQAAGNVILVAPTGFGKTVVMGQLAKQSGASP
jgi:superfamily II DNA or RNA helicase